MTIKLGRPAVSELSCFSAVDRLWSLPLGFLLPPPPTATYISSFYFYYFQRRYSNPPQTQNHRPSLTCSNPSTPSSTKGRRLSRNLSNSQRQSPPPLIDAFTDLPSSHRSSNDAKSYLKPTMASMLKAPSRPKRSSITMATFRY